MMQPLALCNTLSAAGERRWRRSMGQQGQGVDTSQKGPAVAWTSVLCQQEEEDKQEGKAAVGNGAVGTGGGGKV